MTRILLIVFTFINTCAFTQNYQMIQSNRITYFSNTNNRFHNPIRIDSVRIENKDSILYPAPSIVSVANGKGGYCLNPTEASWLGKAIIIKENGENAFINIDGDTLVFNTQASLNDTWEVMRWNDTSYIEARVLSIEQEQFLGLEDSVKTIGFRVVGRSEDFSKIEKEQVKISKNYGIVRTFNFHYFPRLEVFDYLESNEFIVYDSTFFSLATMELSGLSNPVVGISEPNLGQIYDYDIGDEIHLLGGYWSHGLTVVNKTNQIILDKTVFGSDSVRYKIKRVIENQEPVFGIAISSTFSVDTVDIVVRLNNSSAEIDQLSGISHFYRNGAFMHQLYKNDNGRLVKKGNDYRNYLESQSLDDTCWVEAGKSERDRGFFIGFTGNKYIEGVGGPFYRDEIIDFSEFSLVNYYKKGDETFGQPQDIITGLKNEVFFEKNNNLIYPNPSSGQVKISSLEKEKINQLIILDLNGQSVFKTEIENINQEINLSHINSGIYMYKIITESNRQLIGRLILD